MKRHFSRNWRFLLVAVFFVFAFVLIFLRAFQLQLMPEDKVADIAKDQFYRKISLEGRRANIVDARGVLLAVSQKTYSLFADPSLVKSPSRLSSSLAKELKISRGSLKKRLSRKGTRFVWIARKLDPKTARRLQSFNPRALGLIPEFKRNYTLSSLAAQPLGYVSRDGVGLAGLERYYDSFLRGGKERVGIRRDAKGRPVFETLPDFSAEQQWKSLQLTLDSSLQYYSEKTLAEAIEKHKAQAGVVIVMEVETGAIRALASLPSYDPNHYRRYSAKLRSSPFISSPIEPGSVMKVFSVLRALHEDVVDENTVLKTPGKVVKIGRKTISDAHESDAQEKWSVSDLLIKSSNVATIKLARKLGYEKMADNYQLFSFTEKTGIDLGGESRGIFRRPRARQELEWATMSFGQALAVTPMQIVRAFAMIANGGTRVTPHLAAYKIVDGRSSPIERRDLSFTPHAPLLSQDSLKRVTDLMLRVTEEGSGRSARVPGFQVAGKTGTSQKIDSVKGGYKEGAYLASFVGFLPARDPRFVAYVMIDEPSKDTFYGGTVAAPVFSKIMSYAMRLPSYELEKSDAVLLATSREPGSEKN